MTTDKHIAERELHPKSGIAMLCLILGGILLSAAAWIGAAFLISEKTMLILGVPLLILAIVVFLFLLICSGGLKIVNPNEARIFTLFGEYHGTIKQSGFFYIHPLCRSFVPGKTSAVMTALEEISKYSGKPATAVSSYKNAVSLKTQTLNNGQQKVNDILGNPIIIGAIVIWHVADPTQAVFAVENYLEYLSIQTDSTIRNVARLYPYDSFEEDDEDETVQEKTLRGSAVEIADQMQTELQKRVQEAGLIIEEVRITHLAYAEEIAAAMLQRQQASAIIAARKKIVDGAVGMVKMAVDKLGEDEIVILDEERKAAMVSNLLVVLCGNKDAQPIVNSGSIY